MDKQVFQMKSNLQIAYMICNPDWIEPEASMLHNLWSNLEHLGLYQDNPRYDKIIELATKQYPYEN